MEAQREGEIWPTMHDQKTARPEPECRRMSANSKLFCPFFFPAPSQEHKGRFLSASVSPLSLSQPDRSDGHRRDKDVHCTSPQAGHLPLDATPAGPRGELAAGTSSPMHPSQCHILCRWSYRPPLPMYLPCWHCPGQRAEHRGFPTLPPLPRTFPSLGFFYRFGGGGSQGGDPDNKEIGSQLALRWDGLFPHEGALALLPNQKADLLFPPSFLPSRDHCLEYLIPTHPGLNFYG